MCYQIGGESPTPPLRRPHFETVEDAMDAATAALAARSFENVVVAMESVALLSLEELTSWQRELLDLGYRKVMGAKRNARKVLEMIKLWESQRGFNVECVINREFTRQAEKEMDKICGDAKYIIDVHVLYYETSSEALVFYHLLLGDLYRYRCELKSGESWAKIASASLHEYERAERFALDLPGNSPLRLSLAVSLSILCHEILDLSQRARGIIKKALDAATGELDEGCKLSVRTLNENFHTWFNAMGDEGSAPAPAAGGSEGAESNGENVDGGYEAQVEDNGGVDSSSSSGSFYSVGDGGASEAQSVGNADGGETAGENIGVDNVDEGYEAGVDDSFTGILSSSS